MATRIHPEARAALWELARRQQWVVTRAQLIELGLNPAAIRHRIASGRLHRIGRGLYVVGRPAVSPLGRWMAAVLACGRTAVLSHSSAAALWRIGEERPGVIEVSVAHCTTRQRPGIAVHRRVVLTDADTTRRHGIPVTTVGSTLVDQATRLARRPLEAAIGEADRLGLITPPALRAALESYAGWPGVTHLRQTLDRRTFRLTRSELERRFLPLARRAGLEVPETGRVVNGVEVDFYWPRLGLVVETDGLTYHRTPAQQTKDRLRDQAHTAAGLTPLRFTHEQIAYEPDYVVAVLRRVAARLRGAA